MKILNYKLKNGEDITDICKKFKTTEASIYSLNNKKEFACGEVILIPVKIKAVFLPSDNIDSIAKKLFTTSEELEKNFGNKFFIGEKFEL